MAPMMIRLATFIFALHLFLSFQACAPVPYDYSYTLGCMPEPVAPQFCGGTIINPEFDGGLEGLIGVGNAELACARSSSDNNYVEISEILKVESDGASQSFNLDKDMFYVVSVCRPVFDDNGVVLFDGKIGVWPFVEEVIAKRNINMRRRRTIEIKPVQSINRQVIRECILNQVIPSIKQKWPAFLSKNIKIQQDNARPHISNNDGEFQHAANSDGFEIAIVQQPANSPDCNVLDLGFHCAIQSLQQRIRSKNADELIAAVGTSFNAIDPMSLNKVFLSLQCVLVEILKMKGGNNYKQQHMKKNALLRQGNMPSNLEVPINLVRETIEYLIGEDFTEGIEDLIADLGMRVPHVGEGIPDLNM